MAETLISVTYCVALTGLAPHEIILGVVPAARHDRLYESYFSSAVEKPAVTCERIANDIRAAVDLGATAYAADLLIVLRRALAKRVFVISIPTCARPARVPARSLRVAKSVAGRRREGRLTGAAAPTATKLVEFYSDNVLRLDARRRRAAPQG